MTPKVNLAEKKGGFFLVIGLEWARDGVHGGRPSNPTALTKPKTNPIHQKEASKIYKEMIGHESESWVSPSF